MAINILKQSQSRSGNEEIEKIVRTSAQGKYAIQILEGGEIVYSSPEFHKNFIFDYGLDYVATDLWANAFRYCRVGDIPTGSLQTTQTRNSAVQYSLQSEVASSNVYFTGMLPAPYSVVGCASLVISGSGICMRRTYDFNPEVGNHTYTEIGWSPNAGGNLFSRVIATSGGLTGVTVLEGQSIRVIYELDVFAGPNNLASTNPITGWGSDGVMGIQQFGLSCVSPSGTTTFWDTSSGSNEPSYGAKAFISDVSTALSAIGATSNRTSANTYEANVQMFPYTNGTFSRRKRFFIPAASGVYSAYRSVGIGASGAGNLAANTSSFVHVFNAAVNKQLDYILNLNFYYTWGRIT